MHFVDPIRHGKQFFWFMYSYVCVAYMCICVRTLHIQQTRIFPKAKNSFVKDLVAFVCRTCSLFNWILFEWIEYTSVCLYVCISVGCSNRLSQWLQTRALLTPVQHLVFVYVMKQAKWIWWYRISWLILLLSLYLSIFIPAIQQKKYANI